MDRANDQQVLATEFWLWIIRTKSAEVAWYSLRVATVGTQEFDFISLHSGRHCTCKFVEGYV